MFSLFWLKKNNFNFDSILLLKSCPIFDSAALRQFTKHKFSLKAINFFDKIKLILDPPGLSKKNQADITNYVLLQNMPCFFPNYIFPNEYR